MLYRKISVFLFCSSSLDVYFLRKIRLTYEGQRIKGSVCAFPCAGKRDVSPAAPLPSAIKTRSGGEDEEWNRCLVIATSYASLNFRFIRKVFQILNGL